MVILVSSIQRKVLFSLEVAHDLLNIMGEDLGLTEEDEVRMVDLSEVLQVEDISVQAFHIPSQGNQ